MLKKYDRELIESWKEGINFQLIFVSIVSFVASSRVAETIPL